MDGLDTLLYCGLFFGDNRRLEELQLHNLENISDKDWDDMRGDMLEDEITLHKAVEKFDLDIIERDKISLMVTLLRVPPTREETLKILRKRVKKLGNVTS